MLIVLSAIGSGSVFVLVAVDRLLACGLMMSSKIEGCVREYKVCVFRVCVCVVKYL
jgi:hypothetical protein